MKSYATTSPRRASGPPKILTRRRWIKRVLIGLAFFGAGSILGIFAVFYYLSLGLPTIGPLLKGYHPPQTTRILARDGTVLGEIFEERRTVMPLDQIPQVMIDAVISAEDANFRHHQGLDYPGMIRALVNNLVSGRLSQGASTITQQVARTFFLTREKTFARKIREILLTKRIEERLTKDEILFLYLNQINFGHARYGVFEASRFYFGQPIEEITLAQAALLAGIPKGPSLYSPITHPQAAKKRRAYVLGEMAALNRITPSLHKAALAAPLGVHEERGIDARLAPEAVGRAVAELKTIIDMKRLRHGGYTIETTIDPNLQRAARRALQGGLKAIDKRHGRIGPVRAIQGRRDTAAKNPSTLREGKTYQAIVVGHDEQNSRIVVRINNKQGILDLKRSVRYNPDDLTASAFAPKGSELPVSLVGPPTPGTPLNLRLEMGPQGALVAVRSEDASIAAIIGGYDGTPGGFDRASNAHRQPGSAFKPFVYLAAIRTGRYTAATLIDDAPEVHGEWRPGNVDEGKYAGAVRLRQALARSLNLPAVKLMADVGAVPVAEIAAELGIASPLDPTPSLALGTSVVTPLEMATAMSALARGGMRRDPWIIERVVDPDNIEIPVPRRLAKRIISEQEAYVITSLLTSVVEEGTATAARALKHPAAGKTGTSNDQRDAWFVGYTPAYTCAVWVGYDDLRPLGAKEYGGRAALPIWIEFMENAHRNHKKRAFMQPEGLVTVLIDPASGLRAYEGMETAKEEIFIEGTEPIETAIPPDLTSPDSFLLEQTGNDLQITP